MLQLIDFIATVLNMVWFLDCLERPLALRYIAVFLKRETIRKVP